MRGRAGLRRARPRRSTRATPSVGRYGVGCRARMGHHRGPCACAAWAIGSAPWCTRARCARHQKPWAPHPPPHPGSSGEGVSQVRRRAAAVLELRARLAAARRAAAPSQARCPERITTGAHPHRKRSAPLERRSAGGSTKRRSEARRIFAGGQRRGATQGQWSGAMRPPAQHMRGAPGRRPRIRPRRGRQDAAKERRAEQRAQTPLHARGAQAAGSSARVAPERSTLGARKPPRSVRTVAWAAPRGHQARWGSRRVGSEIATPLRGAIRAQLGQHI